MAVGEFHSTGKRGMVRKYQDDEIFFEVAEIAEVAKVGEIECRDHWLNRVDPPFPKHSIQ